ncbi:uridine kinase family protein [Actinacidiphila sp. bgisy167]|uniref:uridine kinase family protein n=1 Tax=Actinacidiphila sp. bgisy167 TaxID=3413797 RepID=UPI003D73907A
MDHRISPGALPALAARLRALPPSCGSVRLVAVDGHAGSGKTTFAGALAGALDGAPVVHLDDLATHEQLFEWPGRLREQVLEPLRRGETARPAKYDWVARRFATALEVPSAPVVLLEGVGAGRREVRPWLAALLWLEVSREVARERGERRDGPGLAGFWEGWMRAQDAHFAADPSRPFADLLVHQGPDGYELRDQAESSPLTSAVRHRT